MKILFQLFLLILMIVIGNVFYSDGLIVVNQKGSYKDVGFGTGYTLQHQATHK